MKICFLGINYGTSYLIKEWYESIIKLNHDAHFYIVDNYSTEQERLDITELCNELGIQLIKFENIGYGQALNRAFSIIQGHYNSSDFAIVGGNLDIRFLNFPINLSTGNYVYVPQVIENNKNKNPFLTKFQSRFLKLYKLAIVLNSPFVLKIIIALFKILRFFPSNIWALHGSLFCFHSSVLSKTKIFNEKSFLYCEELDFASYIEKISKSTFQFTDIKYEHIKNATTSEILESSRSFFNIWKPSFLNWLKRWH
tara:strand:+ start:13214 stop:13975 length:762 start_codon:yes stop_codon:yes gene_type:complete